MQTPFKKFGITQDQVLRLSTYYGLFSLGGVIYAGWLNNKIGEGYSLILFTFFGFLGSLVMSIGVWYESYTIMAISKLISGLGHKTMFLILYVICKKWFQYKYYALSFATSGGGFYAASIISGYLNP